MKYQKISIWYFCAINLDKEALVKLEEDYAKREVVVVSNNSANRNKDECTDDYSRD